MLNSTAIENKTQGIPLILRFFQFFESLGVLVILAVVVLVTSLIAPGFFTPNNIINVIITASILAVTGFGMTFAIAMKGMDLSVGSTQAFTACIAASLMGIVNIPLSILGTIIVGLMIGIINGLLISKLHVPGFVATMGMMSIVRGAALLFTNGQSILIMGHDEYALLNTGKVLGLPVPLIIALITLALAFVVLKHTPFGRHVCAIGGNEAASITTGINIDRTTILVFGIVGATAALSGVMLSSQLMIVDGTLGAGLELQAIAICVLGGTSMAGGNGNLVGTLLGAILLSVINSALNILKVPPFYQYLALGVLLIFALGIDTLRRIIVTKSMREGVK